MAVKYLLEEAVAQLYDRCGSAAAIATEFGLPSRFAFGRLLRCLGAPTVRVCCRRALVLGWLRDYELSGNSLSRQVLRSGQDPSWAYRLVAKTTGLSWRELKRLGSGWLIAQFIAERADVPHQTCFTGKQDAVWPAPPFLGSR